MTLVFGRRRAKNGAKNKRLNSHPDGEFMNHPVACVTMVPQVLFFGGNPDRLTEAQSTF
jgi:hypothetical protein